MNIEVLLIASGQNVKRLLAFGGHRPKKLAQAAALRPPTATGHKIRRAREHRAERSWLPSRVFFNSLDRFRYSDFGSALALCSPSCRVEDFSDVRSCTTKKFPKKDAHTLEFIHDSSKIHRLLF